MYNVHLYKHHGVWAIHFSCLLLICRTVMVSRSFISHECLFLIDKTIIVSGPFTSHEFLPNVAHPLTLPLIKGGVLQHTNLVPKVYKLKHEKY